MDVKDWLYRLGVNDGQIGLPPSTQAHAYRDGYNVGRLEREAELAKRNNRG